MRTLLAATMKNEGPFILEWVAWYRLLGFDDIVIAQNDSTDLTAEILSSLDEIGAIQYVDNSDPGEAAVPENHQGRAYNRISTLPAYRSSDWAITLDADEFLAVTVGSGRVADLIEAVGENADQIHIHWTQIGSNGLSVFEDDLVTTRFTQARPMDFVSRTPVCFKTLYRTGAFASLGVHRPLPNCLDTDRAVTASGIRLAPEDMMVWGSKDPGGAKYAQILHYQIKDAESFVLGRTRGRCGLEQKPSETLGYWSQADSRDRSTDLISHHSERIRAEIARLNDMSGGKLLALHQQSVALTRNRIRECHNDPELSAFYDEVCRLQSRMRGSEWREAMIELYEQGHITWRPK